MDAVALDGVALEALDGLSGKEAVDVVEPVGDSELGSSEIAASIADLALDELGLAIVEPGEGGVAREVRGVEVAAGPEGVRRGVAEDEAPSSEDFAFRLGFFITFVAGILLIFEPSGSAEQAISLLTFVIGLVFLAIVMIMARLGNRKP